MNIVLLVLFVISISVNQVSAKVYRLYYLGGQSNMEGLGDVTDLTDSLAVLIRDVMIFHGNSSPDNTPLDGRGIWSTLVPGHGDGFKSDGRQNIYSDCFGVELSFAHTIRKLQPANPIAIIKYSRGATSISKKAAGRAGCWEPDYLDCAGINQYDHFLATLRNALAIRDIDSDGEEDILIPAGIVWMQGESDASFVQEIARQYEQNLRQLMDLMRAALRGDDLPVVVGLITDSGDAQDGKVWAYGAIVQQAQESYVQNDCCAALVISTKNCGYSDPWHYDSQGYIDLGRECALAMIKLQDCGSLLFHNMNGTK